MAIPSLTLGATNVLIILISSVDLNALGGRFGLFDGAGTSFHGEIFNAGLLHQVGWAFAGGIAAGPVALIFLPVLERLWNTASTFKLHHYTDPQHPLLRALLTKAPGTYQHAMTVVHLAECAGEAVGATLSCFERERIFMVLERAPPQGISWKTSSTGRTLTMKSNRW